jgi:catechol 2,3-dioxygenase-like lactoylglutathione lyase family enzyme
MNKGKITRLAHVGIGGDSTYELLDYYTNILGIENSMSQNIDHPYIGRINGVTGCKYEIGFIAAAGDDTRLEFVGCVDAVKGNTIRGFHLDGHMHITYRTDSIDICHKRLEGSGVEFVSGIIDVDFGKLNGTRAFFIKDPMGSYVEIAGPRNEDGVGRLTSLTSVTYVVYDTKTLIKNIKEAMRFDVKENPISSGKYFKALYGENNLPEKVYSVELDPSQDFSFYIIPSEDYNPAVKDIMVRTEGSIHLCVMVDDIDSVYDHMKKNGVPFVGPPSPVEIGVNKGARAVFCKLADEVLVELFQGKPTKV